MSIKEGVVLTTAQDYKKMLLAYPLARTRYLASDYDVLLHLPQSPIEYFFEPSFGDSHEHDGMLHFCFNWHRDENGQDKLSNSEVSWGAAICRRLLFIFCSDYKYYKNLKRWLNCLDVIHISENEVPSLLRVAEYFPGQIFKYKSCVPQNKRMMATELFAKPRQTPNIHRLSGLARLVQLPFLFLARRRKHLYIPDWTSLEMAKKRHDTLVMNSFFPWKGCYYQLKPWYVSPAEKEFEKKIPAEVLDKAVLMRALERSGLEVRDENLVDLFITTVEREYALARPFYVKAHAIFSELYTRYRPSLVSFPGETSFAHVIGQQLAKKMGIETMLVADGYAYMNDRSVFYFDTTGKNFLIDKFAGFGQAHFDLQQICGVAREKCVLMRPPVVQHHVKNQQHEKIYDALVMMANANLLNPLARWDCADKFLLDVIGVLCKLGYVKIAIKAKMYGSIAQSSAVLELVKIKYGESILKNIEILTGNFHDHLSKAKCVIGQCSTAILEATYHRTPYFIYEPYEMGRTDDFLASSKVFCLQDVARTPEQLEKRLRAGHGSVTADWHYIFDGPGFDEVPLI